MGNHPSHDLRAGQLDHWRQVSFIFFDLGAMNLLAGAGFAIFSSLPLSILGFRSNSFWLGLMFILAGLVSWKLRRLPIVVPVVIIAADLWLTVRMLPLIERSGYVVLVQTSFVLPLVFTLISILRARFKQGLLKTSQTPTSSSSNAHIGTGRQALALLTSMLVSVGMGLTALVLFSNYVLNQIAESTNSFVNMFHDFFLIPILLALFPLGAALGELVWIRMSRFYLTGHEVSLIIRYIKQIPLISRIADLMIRHNSIRTEPDASEIGQTDLHPVIVNHKSQKTWWRHPLWLAPLALILMLLTAGVVVIRPFESFSNFRRAEASEETVPPAGALVVSQSGRGNYQTIKEALDHAKPGATILVRPGVYHERLLIDKPINLIGDGSGRRLATIECAEDVCVSIRADATLRNLTVRAQVGLLKWVLLGGEPPTAIEVLNSHPTIDSCDVSSNRGAGLVVTGAEAAPEIRNTRAHDCRLNGILFTNGSRGIVENSEIYKNRWAGIRSDANSYPIVRRSRIHHGQMDGIIITENGGGTFEECEISDNSFSGVHVREGSSVTLKHSRVFNQERGGVFVHDRSFGTVEECEIFGNGYAGIEIADQGDAVVLNSKVHHGEMNGIIVWRQSTATVEGSLIYENKSSGLLIAGGSKPVIRKTIFRSNLYSAVEVSEGSDPVLEECQIYDGRSSGIYFYDGGNGRVFECSIFGNMNANVVIASGSNPQIKKSTLSESRQAGLLVTQGGHGLIEDCKILSNYIGIEIKQDGAPVVQNCKINNNRYQGVAADGTSAGSITRSELNGNSGGAWKIDAGSRVAQSQNLE